VTDAGAAIRSRTPSTATRKGRLLRRAAPLAVVAVVAFVAGMSLSGNSGERDAVQRFGEAWSDGDYEAMAAELTPPAAAEYDAAALEEAYADAAATATSESLSIGEARGPLEDGGEEVVALPVAVRTAAFGTVEGEIAVPVTDDGVEWASHLVFPGLRPDERLERRTRLHERAPILAADRSPLAEGPAEARVTTGAGGIVTGEISEAKGRQRDALEARGIPADAPTGTSGLELAFDEALAGTPGGELLAVGGGERRELVSTEPTRGEPVRTTIDPAIQDAAAAALGDTFGGAAVLDARDGDVLGLAGIAFSAPQPPGSTMKVITTVGALEAGITKPGEEFPVQTSAVVGGYEVANAYDEPCGGNLVVSFAKSCNTVFAPLGAELGGEKLVQISERFGFNQPPTLYNDAAIAAVEPAQSTIPADISDDLDAAVSAIGQGEVLATPLSMASVSQTIANGGMRSPTAIVRDPELSGDRPDVEVASPEVAEQVKAMMIEVVNSGTGTAAALPDAQVAGKTGTAELGTVSSDEPVPEGEEPKQDVDAWFTAFAPAENPKVAVAVLVVNADGDGGAVAAPIARAILEASL
jgi:peptidoglycan glycosyltransferase